MHLHRVLVVATCNEIGTFRVSVPAQAAARYGKGKVLHEVSYPSGTHMYGVDVLPELPKKKIDSTVSDAELDSVDSDNNHGSNTLHASQHISNEVNLEVAIRERLATTIEGRIQWALQMLDALSNAREPEDPSLDADDFQDAALDALDALEAPSAFLFDTGFADDQYPSSLASPILPNQPVPQRAPKTRSSRTPKPSQQKKHLYIKLPSSASECQLALLACPICSRTQFTTLQGLLNHARLAHGVEWASHDACITACAVPVSADARSREAYEREGVEVLWGGNVVGLRRLFERAVGIDGILSTSPLLHATSGGFLESSATAPSTLLSRTLGLHADSPALAQFLGRARKRRCIHVYDEDQQVNITTLADTRPQSTPPVPEEPEKEKPKKGFRMRYPHRNTARKDLDLVVDVHMEVETTNVNRVSTPAIIPGGTTTSRFHITARVRLEDRSLLLKEDRRNQLGIADQYRWMLGVTAPSYSLPLPSFLTCLTVIPPKAVSPRILTVHRQPFAVVGTANEPFMAKVIFEWVGGGKMEAEHWVELDQSRSYTSVFGSEQLLDVELDRNIPLLPVPKESPPLPSLDRRFPFGAHADSTLQPDTVVGETLTTGEGSYEQILRDLASKVPMTAKDVKSRTTIQVPYKLVASPAQLLALMPGRRKAIEWARARALHALYVEHLGSVSPHRRTTLTVGDVYMFLEDASYFPRPLRSTPGPLPDLKKKRKDKDGASVLGEESCPICGIKKRLHPGYDVKSEEGTLHWTCAVVPTAEQRYGQRFPLANLTKVLAWSNELAEAVRDLPLPPPSSVPNQTLKTFIPPYQYSPRDLLTITPPEFILAVHKVVSKLRLAAFLGFAPCGDNPAFLNDREHVERCLAPVALLSATLKPFVSVLIRSGIEIAKRDATSILSGARDGRAKRMKKLTLVLTPGHVLRGLRLQGVNSVRVAPGVTRTAMNCDPRTRESAAMCLAQLGVRLDFGEGVAGTDGAGTVKAEPE